MDVIRKPGRDNGAFKMELESAGKGLSASADLLRAVLASSGDCIKILDLEGRLQFMSEGGKRVMEVDDFSRLKGCAWPDFWGESGHITAAAAVEEARQGREARFKGPANTARGNPRYWDVQVSPIFGEDGQPAFLLSISRDITDEWHAEAELKNSAERQQVLAEELQHRIKNTLAMVGAIANQTMRGEDVLAARQAFLARLHTLSRAHDILNLASWTGATISKVVEAAIAAHKPEGDRIQIEGPPSHISAKQALALALAVHELATNAAKYGALSNNVGTVRVEWSATSIAARLMFVFRWIESGGPLVTTPTRTGFGTRLLARVMENEFHANVSLTYPQSGLRYEVIAPLDRLGKED